MEAGEGIIGRGKGMGEGPELGNNRALTEYIMQDAGRDQTTGNCEDPCGFSSVLWTAAAREGSLPSTVANTQAKTEAASLFPHIPTLPVAIILPTARGESGFFSLFSPSPGPAYSASTAHEIVTPCPTA